MIKLNLLKFFFIILFLSNTVYANCNSKSKIKIGIIDSQFINYKYYLQYTLDNYSIKNDIEFEINYVNKNINEFDIIFGEYHHLNKLSKIEIDLPDKIDNFYKKNGIKLSHNLLPLDLDTFVILSKKEGEKLFLEDLSNEIDPFRYTLGMSFTPKENLIKSFLYSLEGSSININSINFESKLDIFKNAFKNQNKNILYSNYEEIFESFEEEENLYTVFNDGILLYDDINYESFQLFPKSKYSWDKDKGVFEKNELVNPYSFFGFSAYINSFDQFGFLCHLVDEETRINSFKRFNISLSPLSIKELSLIKDEIPSKYIEILEIKKNFILNTNINENLDYYELLVGAISGKYKLSDKIDTSNYLGF